MTVPVALRRLNQWAVWRYEVREGKPTKVPYSPDGRRASSTHSATWRSYEDVCTALERDPEGYAGRGFVFTSGDPFTGIDLDNCLDESGRPKDWAAPFLQTFHDSYSEVSPSGRGVKIWAKGKLPAQGKRRQNYEDG